jgi:ABC-type polysaccharide/polyol phosphate export permease
MVDMVVVLNPLAHLLELVRAPLLGHSISAHVYGLACVMTVAGCVITSALFARYRSRIAYWV